MWIITTDGFYSVVDKQSGSTLTVRARAASDLDRLRANHLPELGPTLTGVGTDYPHRATVDRQAFSAALAAVASDIDYDNFKKAVALRQGTQRAHVLATVWRDLLRLEDEK